MADEPVLEIWSNKRLSIHFHETKSIGEAPLDDKIKSFLESNITLSKNDRIACLYELQIFQSSNWMDPNTCDWIITEAPFSWHYGLNKPTKGQNEVVEREYPNRHKIGLDAGILPIGVMGVTLTEDKSFILGIRNPASTHTVGNYCLVPAGFCSLNRKNVEAKSIFVDTIRREFLEEVIYNERGFNELNQATVEALVRPHMEERTARGLTYVDQATNRGFGLPVLVHIKYTTSILRDLLKAKDPDGEHLGYLLREFSPGSIEDLVREYKQAVEIHTVGALLCIGANEFDNGIEWYNKMVNEVVPQNYGRVLTLPGDTFDKGRKVVEVIKETMPQRYPK